MMNRRALKGREKVLGNEHPATLSSLSNLATVRERQGKYEEAEVMNRRALKGKEKVLGYEHPDTLTSSTVGTSERQPRRCTGGREQVAKKDSINKQEIEQE